MNIGLRRFALLTALACFVLVIAGALVTSTGSGLAVPDWPLSFGQFFPTMEGGVSYEHGHRMIAGVVGILTFVLTLWIWLKEKRQSLKILSLAASLAVVTQALLGGLTVLYRLPTAISVGHACLGQIFFSLLVCLAAFISVDWKSLAISDTKLKILCGGTAAVLFLQLFLGAWMRHADAGLAIPDFPLSFGRLMPNFDNEKIAIHFAHRANAILTALVVGALLFYCVKFYREEPQIFFPTAALAVFVVFQAFFGALIIWSQKAVFFTSVHVAIGALALAASFLLVGRAFSTCARW